MTDTAISPSAETGLVKDLNNLPALGTSAGFLPYIQLASINAAIVAENKCRGGDFVIFANDKDKPEVLGPAFDAIVLDWRTKAMHLVDSKPEIIVFDFNSPEFAKIRECEGMPQYKYGSGDPNSFMWGAEFLLWIPKAKGGTGSFGVYFMASKTARNEAENLRSFLVTGPKGAYVACVANVHFNSFLVKKKTNYFVPQTSKTDAELAPPDEDETAKVLQQFLNPKVVLKEVATGTQRDR